MKKVVVYLLASTCLLLIGIAIGLGLGFLRDRNTQRFRDPIQLDALAAKESLIQAFTNAEKVEFVMYRLDGEGGVSRIGPVVIHDAGVRKRLSSGLRATGNPSGVAYRTRFEGVSPDEETRITDVMLTIVGDNVVYCRLAGGDLFCWSAAEGVVTPSYEEFRMYLTFPYFAIELARLAEEAVMLQPDLLTRLGNK